ncbi:unnamed protein product [Vitrella brassicaformis CCMP3155]|uniref:Uncharacterized protein n=1 Tax=Vitrella brassicaformis (strain CCMP3155) TaxID=1169540 RepID=A0A0G4FSL4_VITBC|nr:unnamed protein product [Vitrella brassicaformis CCMP3155]|eukprot:CEM17655.1 unnamed protein product [Vitrella brassicaformis CCMP3155]
MSRPLYEACGRFLIALECQVRLSLPDFGRLCDQIHVNAVVFIGKLLAYPISNFSLAFEEIDVLRKIEPQEKLSMEVFVILVELICSCLSKLRVVESTTPPALRFNLDPRQSPCIDEEDDHRRRFPVAERMKMDLSRTIKDPKKGAPVAGHSRKMMQKLASMDVLLVGLPPVSPSKRLSVLRPLFSKDDLTHLNNAIIRYIQWWGLVRTGSFLEYDRKRTRSATVEPLQLKPFHPMTSKSAWTPIPPPSSQRDTSYLLT